jgi:hypothetical protein
MPTPTFPERPRNGDEFGDEAEFDGIDLDDLVELGELEDPESDIPLLLTEPPAEPGNGSLAAFAGGAVEADDVARLSDLGREASRRFTAEWPALPLEVRERIVRLMDELPEERVELRFGRALRVALCDEDAAIRQLALAALWDDEGSDLPVLLLAVLTGDPSLDVRAEAARALAPFAEQAEAGDLDPVVAGKIRERLLEAAEDPAEDRLVRRLALESAAIFRGESLDDLIREAYDSGEQDQMESALFAMGQTMDRGWLPILLEEMTSHEAVLRFEAARAAGRIGSDTAVAELMAMMDGEEDVEVRHAVIGALGEIGGKAATRALETLASQAEEADAELIADALAEAAGDSGGGIGV